MTSSFFYVTRNRLVVIGTWSILGGFIKLRKLNGKTIVTEILEVDVEIFIIPTKTNVMPFTILTMESRRACRSFFV